MEEKDTLHPSDVNLVNILTDPDIDKSTRFIYIIKYLHKIENGDILNSDIIEFIINENDEYKRWVKCYNNHKHISYDELINLYNPLTYNPDHLIELDDFLSKISPNSRTSINIQISNIIREFLYEKISYNTINKFLGQWGNIFDYIFWPTDINIIEPPLRISEDCKVLYYVDKDMILTSEYLKEY